MLILLWVSLLASLWAVAAGAAAEPATVYRWVDKKGQVHFGDSVPSEYQQVAKPVAVQATVPSVEAQRQAQDRAAALLANARRTSVAGAASAASASVGPAAAPAASPKRPAQGPNESSDCDTWRRLYQESLECFGPYRTTRGATKAEAFDHCTPVAEPPQRCGRGTP